MDIISSLFDVLCEYWRRSFITLAIVSDENSSTWFKPLEECLKQSWLVLERKKGQMMITLKKEYESSRVITAYLDVENDYCLLGCGK